MNYPPETIREIAAGYDRVIAGTSDLLSRLVHAGSEHEGSLREHLSHGAARRISVIRRAIKNVFAIFPPTREQKLEGDELADAQINVHAFCINVSGFLDNLAWAFVLRHDLLAAVGGQHGVSLFKEALQQHLPAPIRDGAAAMATWQSRYLKNYRDALAHRIPLYIPPFQLTNLETERYKFLEAQSHELLFGPDHEAYLSALTELDALGSAAPVFLHSFEFGQDYQPVPLHPQLLLDSATIVDFGDVYIKHWQERAQ